MIKQSVEYGTLTRVLHSEKVCDGQFNVYRLTSGYLFCIVRDI